MNVNPDSFHRFAQILHQECESYCILSFQFIIGISMCLIAATNEAWICVWFLERTIGLGVG